MEDANTCHLYKNVSDVKLYCGTEAIPSNVSADFYGKIKIIFQIKYILNLLHHQPTTSYRGSMGEFRR